MPIPISKIYQYHELHHRLFPLLRFEIDPIMTVLEKRVVIDVVRLGKELEKMYPEEYETMSIKEILEAHYSKEANEFINDCI